MLLMGLMLWHEYLHISVVTLPTFLVIKETIQFAVHGFVGLG